MRISSRESTLSFTYFIKAPGKSIMSENNISEREVIKKFEKATTPEQLTQILANPTAKEERALRAYLGNDRFRRLYILARSLGETRTGRRVVKGNVVILPGIMGSELTLADNTQSQWLVWFHMFHIYRGWLEKLQLDEAGRDELDRDYRAFPTNVWNKYYGEIVLHLSRNWKARAFWYDWRKSLSSASFDLAHFIHREFHGEDVTLVAHSMGGLVARTLLLDQTNRKLVKRLIMLGTPNYGSFEVPQIFTGIQGTVKSLITLAGGLTGFFSSSPKTEMLELLDSFPGVYQLMPWPEKVSANQKPLVKKLYDPTSYFPVNPTVSSRHLQNALNHHQELNKKVIDAKKLIYIAGYGERTFDGIRNENKLDETAGYRLTRLGDGSVPHSLGLLPNVPSYFLPCKHVDLPRHPDVLHALNELIEKGSTEQLPPKIPAERAVKEVDQDAEHKELKKEREQEEQQIQEILDRMSRRWVNVRAGKAGQIEGPEIVTEDERELEEMIVGSVLGSSTKEEDEPEPKGPKPEISIALELRDIKEADKIKDVDAICGGIYVGVRPCGAVHHLDLSISEAMPFNKDSNGSSECYLSELIERGTIRGELGVPFFLPDPRKDGDNRVIALAGLGSPGQCGIPELELTIRELVWALNALGKKHMATLLIGAGTGNLEIGEALEAFLLGIAQALSGIQSSDGLKQVTIIEKDARRLSLIAEELDRLKARPSIKNKLTVDFVYDSDRQEELWKKRWEDTLKSLEEEKKHAEKMKKEPPKKESELSGQPADHSVARITFEMDENLYTFGAITDEAAIPQRIVEINTALVTETNNHLVAATSLQDQKKNGQVLGCLLIHEDLRNQFRTNVPLVMEVDSRSARIHWEAIVVETGGVNDKDWRDGEFLGLARGFTRQLRTSLAPAPEPPPTTRRKLKVLIVADPAPDAHLEGALAEGEEVKELFRIFNEMHSGKTRVEVKTLFGPIEANQIEVLAELLLGSYDILHFAGHCFFDINNPYNSGYIFRANPRSVLSARELRRIPRVPRFVFSNACESGVTRDRPESRDARLAPSFAEVFFERGVANFVCTAWPVNDLAARLFARHLYAGLLGIEVKQNPYELKVNRTPVKPLSMHRAMRNARKAVSAQMSGIRTWAAYQHYGNPHSRFFPESITG